MKFLIMLYSSLKDFW